LGKGQKCEYYMKCRAVRRARRRSIGINLGRGGDRGTKWEVATERGMVREQRIPHRKGAHENRKDAPETVKREVAMGSVKRRKRKKPEPDKGRTTSQGKSGLRQGGGGFGGRRGTWQRLAISTLGEKLLPQERGPRKRMDARKRRLKAWDVRQGERVFY